jgi:hypothetical protein
MFYIVSCNASLVLPRIACIVSPHDAMVLPYWIWFALFHFMLTGASLLGMAYVISPPSLGHHYWAWFVLFHFMLHLFLLTGHGSYCFISCFTGTSLLGMACIVSFHVLLVPS